MEMDRHEFSFDELNELYSHKRIICCDKGFYIVYVYNQKKEKNSCMDNINRAF